MTEWKALWDELEEVRSARPYTSIAIELHSTILCSLACTFCVISIELFIGDVNVCLISSLSTTT